MHYLKIRQTDRLEGTVAVQGSKNAVLPMIAGSVLCDGPVILTHCPDISDVRVMLSILEDLGAEIHFKDGRLEIYPPENPDSPEKLKGLAESAKICRLRASILFLGSMLGRWNHVRLGYPGGCAIGKRPIDQHLKKMEELGFHIEDNGELIRASGSLKGDHVIDLTYPSVGVTENLILSCVVSNRTTIIRNTAKEPEILYLCRFLQKAGARIQVEQSGDCSVIIIEGRKALHGCEYEVPGDRIVAGTFAIAAAAVGGDVSLERAAPETNEALWRILSGMGVEVKLSGDRVRIVSKGAKGLRNLSAVSTAPYPGFPTDLQSLLLPLAAAAAGAMTVTETIFERRFQVLDELNHMGAGLVLKRANIIEVRGDAVFHGCPVWGTELRGSAALVIAGLMAEGTTTLCGIEYLERGYESLHIELNRLGAGIERAESRESLP